MAAMQWRRAGPLCVFVVGLGNMVAQPLRALRDFRDTDYASFIAAARVLASGSRSLYSLTALHAAEGAYIGFVPRPGISNAFLNLPPAALVLVPLTGLPPAAGLGVFLAVALVCLGTSMLLLGTQLLAPVRPPRLRAVITVAAVCSLPAGWSLALGQWDPLLLLAEVVALIWISEGRRRLGAGLLLSLVLLKPHLAYLLPVFLAAARQWRTIAGMAAGALLWAIASFAILGTRVFELAPLIVQNDARQTLETLGLPGFAGMLTGRAVTAMIVWILLAAGAGLAVVRFRRRLATRPAATVALGMAVTLLVSPHVLPYDMLLLALPLAWWGRSHSRAALLTAIVLSAAWVVDVAVGPLTGPHLETFVVLGTVAGLALSFREPSHAADAPRAVAAWPSARALPSTPR